MRQRLRVLSLFSGIGGLDLGLELAGMHVAAQSEVDTYACDVLAKHWPGTPNLGDITRIDWGWGYQGDDGSEVTIANGIDIGRIDVICGGFPCQDLSIAGRRAGITEGTRSGLWSEYVRAIRAIRPRYVIVENVVGLRSKGLDQVLADLAACGFDAWWDTVPASAFGAPHQRERVCVVAYRPNPDGFSVDIGPSEWVLADAQGLGVQGGGPPWEQESRAYAEQRLPWRDGAGVVASQWAVEPALDRVAHGVPARVDRLKTLGNAVIPQLAEYVGALIVEHAQGETV